MNEIEALKKALLHCNKELVVHGIGVFKPTYKPASLSADGRTIVQPRFGWRFCLGSPAYLSASGTKFIASESLSACLLAASEKGESFEIAGFGLFYKQMGCYELIPEPGHLISANQHYGLMPLSIHKVRTVLASDLQVPKTNVATPSNTILKAAAVFLGFLLLSMVAFQYLATDGQLFSRQEAGMNFFGAERETLYQAPLLRERSRKFEDIVEGISQVTDSVINERTQASESAAVYIDSWSKIAPIVKLDDDMHFKRSVFGEQKLVENMNEQREQAAIKKEASVVPLKQNTKIGLSNPDEQKGQNVGLSLKTGTDTSVKNNLAKGEDLKTLVDKKDNQADVASGHGNIYIAVGSFQSIENAERYKSELRAKGFQIAENKSILVGKLQRVVVVSSSSSTTAEAFLTKAQKEISAGVWILKD
jgi:hypothetical protein